jgi:hypothetical protein
MTNDRTQFLAEAREELQSAANLLVIAENEAGGEERKEHQVD